MSHLKSELWNCCGQVVPTRAVVRASVTAFKGFVHVESRQHIRTEINSCVKFITKKGLEKN
jgi:hypothetical protein